jgi:predicted HNH restriction endonuclease
MLTLENTSHLPCQEMKMIMFTIVTENDESEWKDQFGERYHFPKRYATHLQRGTQLLYYKGRMRDRRFAESRLSPEPHYFGAATAGNHRDAKALTALLDKSPDALAVDRNVSRHRSERAHPRLP